MSKVSKRRFCPALKCEITPAECGEKRNTSFVCPPDCGFNPFAASNYDRLLEIEAELDKLSLHWAVAKDKDHSRMIRELERAFDAENPAKSNARLIRNLFGVRDEHGVNVLDRWSMADSAGMKNDLRTLLAAKIKTRLILFEVRKVVDSEIIEIVDLFRPKLGSFPLLDRSAAAVALRFSSGLAWGYPLPHFFRFSGAATILPDILDFGPLEMVTEIVRHLGAPRR